MKKGAHGGGGGRGRGNTAGAFINFLTNMTPSGEVAAQSSRYATRVDSQVIGRLQEGSQLELTVPSSISLRQEPKSARRMWPFTSSRMLSGLMSLKEERQGQNQASLFLSFSSNKK